jgi:hypothetical protein
VTFSGVITGQQADGVNQSIIINNLGNSPLTISNIRFSTASERGPWITANGTASTPAVGPFTFVGLPSSVPAQSSVIVIINFKPASSANYAAFVNVISSGGTSVFDVVGTGSDYPVAKLEFQTPDGTGWVAYDNSTYFTFGNVTENHTLNLKFRVSNVGGPNAGGLSLTVSKPPFGDSGIVGAVNNVDLAEGTIIYAGQNAAAAMYCSVPKSQVNVPAYNGSANWTMNLGDPNFGLRKIMFFCNAVSEQLGPGASTTNGTTTGTPIFEYVGCFQDSTANRQLETQIYDDQTNNTNEKCMAACQAKGWIFAGTEYQSEVSLPRVVHSRLMFHIGPGGLWNSISLGCHIIITDFLLYVVLVWKHDSEQYDGRGRL